ncbi:MAG: hypothetical protein AAGF23_03495 [Acidobacteriota bacterium]
MSTARTASVRRALLALAVAAASAPLPLFAQTPTSFPYGGQLVLDQQRVDTGGEPGAYDFTFRAFDGADPGSSRQVGPALERPGLPLTDGRFETRLDFGADALQAPALWVETTVVQRRPEGAAVVASSRQRITLRANGAGVAPAAVPEGAADGAAAASNPVTSDSQILDRLAAVRVVISDRQSPGEAHFLIDEESFRRAFGVAAPVTAVDAAAVGLVASSQLKRELDASRLRVLELEADVGRLRFRINVTLLLLAAVIASVFLHRRLDDKPRPGGGAAEDGEAAEDVHAPGDAAVVVADDGEGGDAVVETDDADAERP